MSTPNDRYLTLDALRAMIEADEVDTVVLAFTDMQGRLQGKRLHGRYFLDVALEAGTEGCNYLLAVDIDMNTVGRLHDLLVGEGVRRHGVRARLGHPAAAPPPARHRDGAVRPGLARPRAGAAVTAHDAEDAARAGRRHGHGRAGRHRAGVHRLQQHLRGRPRPPVARPHPGQPVQRRLLAGRHLARRTVAARHPQPHVRRRDGRRGREGRVQLRPARDRLPLRRGTRDR